LLGYKDARGAALTRTVALEFSRSAVERSLLLTLVCDFGMFSFRKSTDKESREKLKFYFFANREMVGRISNAVQ
jgi:hypothetical protein